MLRCSFRARALTLPPEHVCLGISTYGPVFLLGFGSFHSQAACALACIASTASAILLIGAFLPQAACSLAFAGAVSVGGVLGTPLGGVLTDTVLSRAKREPARRHATRH